MTYAIARGGWVALATVLWGCADRVSELPCDVGQPDPTTAAVAVTRVLDPQPLADSVAGTHPGVGRIVDAASVGDRIALADGEHQRVTIIDPAGNVVVHQGALDDGSRGYINLQSVVGTGTSFVTYDDYTRRLTVMDPEGRTVRTLEPEWEPPMYHHGRLLAATDDEALVAFRPGGYRQGTRDPMRVRHTVHLFLVSLQDGSVLRHLQRPGTEELAMRRGDTHGGLPVIFGRETFATLADGGLWVLDSAEPALDEARDPGPDPGCRVPVEHRPVPVSAAWAAAVRDSAYRAIEAMVPGTIVLDDGRNFHMVIQDFRREIFNHGLPANPVLPFASGLRGADDGTLWIREFPIPGHDRVSWTQIELPAVRAVARIEMSPHLILADLSHDRLIALEASNFGVRRLLIHEF